MYIRQIKEYQNIVSEIINLAIELNMYLEAYLSFYDRACSNVDWKDRDVHEAVRQFMNDVFTDPKWQEETIIRDQIYKRIDSLDVWRMNRLMKEISDRITCIKVMKDDMSCLDKDAFDKRFALLVGLSVQKELLKKQADQLYEYYSNASDLWECPEAYEDLTEIWEFIQVRDLIKDTLKYYIERNPEEQAAACAFAKYVLKSLEPFSTGEESREFVFGLVAKSDETMEEISFSLKAGILEITESRYTYSDNDGDGYTSLIWSITNRGATDGYFDENTIDTVSMIDSGAKLEVFEPEESDYYSPESTRQVEFCL